MTARVLDHVTIGCASLAQGIAYVHERLGVEVPAGGQHPRMGTHNRLMQVGDSVYLELIAIDPDAPPPGRPRWYALDEPWQQARIAERPRPIAWIVRSSNIAADLTAHPELGTPEEMTRGDLVWRISLRRDGVLPARGLLPVLIEWPSGSPAARMPDLGVRLTRLRLCSDGSGDSKALDATLTRLGKPHAVELSQTSGDRHLELDLRLPSGATVTLK